jgi:AraC-like DNA-binding protein
MNNGILGIKCILKEKETTTNYINRSSLLNFSKGNYQHNGIGLKLVLSGKENYCIDGKWHTVKAGNFLVINDKQNIEVDVKSKSPTQGICIYLTSEKFKQEHKLSTLELAEGVFHLGNNHWLNKIIETLPYQSSLNNEILFDNLLYQLYHENLRITKKLSPLKAKNNLTKIDALRKIEQAKSIISSSTNQKISLQYLADEVGLSKFHFARLFKTLTGTTPAKFQLNYRLNAAFDDLKNSQTSISDLAIKYGFTDVHHFSNAFKQKYHLSPSQID